MKRTLILNLLIVILLGALVIINAGVAYRDKFIIRYINYDVGELGRLMAPTFAWIWATILTVLIAVWITVFRRDSWWEKHKHDDLDPVIIGKIARRDERIRTLERDLAKAELQRDLLKGQNRGAGVLMVKAVDILMNPERQKIYAIAVKKENTA